MNNALILGTLGDNNGFLTCSMQIAKIWGKYETIIPYSKYEFAAQDVKNNKIYCFLVPAAYPGIDNFIMDADLTTIDVFIEKIPPIVYVSKENYPDNEAIDTIYLHPATKFLRQELNLLTGFTTAIYVDSNIEACKFLINDNNKKCAAITNKICADYFKLNIIKILREGIKMPWICFSKISERGIY